MLGGFYLFIYFVVSSLIRRREALVYNTPDDHVTRDIREGIAKLGDLRFRVLDSAGLETEATSGSILSRTTEMTGNVLARSQFAIFLIDVRLVDYICFNPRCISFLVAELTSNVPYKKAWSVGMT